MKKYFLLVILFFTINTTYTQVLTDTYIIDIQENNLDVFNRELAKFDNSENNYKLLSNTLSIVKLKRNKSKDIVFEKWLNKLSFIDSWGYDQLVHPRKSPNDDFYSKQTYLDIIKAEDAWSITTGGQDVNNNEIVVAVMDIGFDLDHPDLKNQIKYNKQEIEDDGIDNDNNGYIDDYAGWNSIDKNDNHPYTDRHGIAVAGIIGATGDNGIGLTGVNWNVKILPITGISNISDVIVGYQYALTMRKLYNETNGEKGAFIVATNYSAGIDGGMGTDPQYQSWCNMYDALAEVGILSAGATANKRYDVAIEGDIPTTCISPYLITVTNSTAVDTLYKRAAYSNIHIDLSAPGVDLFALDQNGYKDGFTGTSSSTPQVAGAIALMYSIKCNAIADLSISSPRLVADLVKNALLSSVDIVSGMEGLVVTNGRLNVYSALKNMEMTCNGLNTAQIRNVKYGNDIFNIAYTTPDNNEYNILVSDRFGNVIRRESFIPNSNEEKLITIEYPLLTTGIYFISIYNDNSINTKKIFIP
ncbi:MAG: S8 family serine peptidase [Saprospiraceae bacterium]